LFMCLNFDSFDYVFQVRLWPSVRNLQMFMRLNFDYVLWTVTAPKSNCGQVSGTAYSVSLYLVSSSGDLTILIESYPSGKSSVLL
jgi:hypothetical protein